jgi:hypothetical protein
MELGHKGLDSELKMLESGKIHPLHRKLQQFCIMGSEALWSKIKIENHNTTVLKLNKAVFNESHASLYH